MSEHSFSIDNSLSSRSIRTPAAGPFVSRFALFLNDSQFVELFQAPPMNMPGSRMMNCIKIEVSQNLLTDLHADLLRICWKPCYDERPRSGI